MAGGRRSIRSSTPTPWTISPRRSGWRRWMGIVYATRCRPGKRACEREPGPYRAILVSMRQRLPYDYRRGVWVRRSPGRVRQSDRYAGRNPACASACRPSSDASACQKRLHRRALLARGHQREIIMLFRQRNEAEARGMRHRRDGHAPVGAMLRHGGGDRVVRLRLIPVAVGTRIAEQPVDQDARAGALVAVDHDAGGIGERRAHRILRVQAFETFVAGTKHDALHPPPARHQFKPIGEKRRVVALGLLVEQMDRREIAFAALGRRQPAEAADRDRAHRRGRHAPAAR